MSEKNAYAQKPKKKRTIRDDIADIGSGLKSLLIPPKARGEVRDAERDRYLREAEKGASLTIKKRRRAA